ncbi:MAG: PTS sugar transporter subunit IIA [Planctomycetia bacterium]|nr:PTS sugar transporter subunit IIA [Planctomycetia bacterium]
MKLCDYLSQEFICLDLSAGTKEEVIRQMAGMLQSTEKITDFPRFVDDIFKREEQGTTGIGNGIAIPHARTDAVDDFVVAVGRSTEGIDFNSIDDKPVHIVILMGTPLVKVQAYLKLLAHMSLLLKGEGFIDRLLAATDASDVLELFRCNEQ